VSCVPAGCATWHASGAGFNRVNDGQLGKQSMHIKYLDSSNPVRGKFVVSHF
jgi:hypothetical protein